MNELLEDYSLRQLQILARYHQLPVDVADTTILINLLTSNYILPFPTSTHINNISQLQHFFSYDINENIVGDQLWFTPEMNFEHYRRYHPRALTEPITYNFIPTTPSKQLYRYLLEGIEGYSKREQDKIKREIMRYLSITQYYILLKPQAQYLEWLLEMLIALWKDRRLRFWAFSLSLNLNNPIITIYPFPDYDEANLTVNLLLRYFDQYDVGTNITEPYCEQLNNLIFTCGGDPELKEELDGTGIFTADLKFLSGQTPLI